MLRMSWLFVAAVSSFASMISAETTEWNCSFGSFNDRPPVNCSIELGPVGHSVRWFVTYRENNFTASKPYLRASLNNPGVREWGNTQFFLPPAAIPSSGRGKLSFRYLFNSNTTTGRNGYFQVRVCKEGRTEGLPLPITTGWSPKSIMFNCKPRQKISFKAARGDDYTNAGIDDISITEIPFPYTEEPGQSTSSYVATTTVSTLRRTNTQTVTPIADLETTTTSSSLNSTLTDISSDHLKATSHGETQTESPAQVILISSSVGSITVVCLLCAIIIVCIRRKHRKKPATPQEPDEDDNGLVVNQLYDATDNLPTSSDVPIGENAPSSNLETHIHSGMDNNYEDVEETQCQDLASRSDHANTYFTLEAPTKTSDSKLNQPSENEYEGVDEGLHCTVDDRPDQDSTTCNDNTYFTLENPSNKDSSNFDQYPENEYEDIGTEALKQMSQNKASDANTLEVPSKNGRFLGATENTYENFDKVDSPNRGDGTITPFANNGSSINDPPEWDDQSTPAYFTLESRSSKGDGGDTRIDSKVHEITALTGQVPHVMNASKKRPRGIPVMPFGQGLSNSPKSKDRGSSIRNHSECPVEGVNSKSHLDNQRQKNRSTGKPKGPTKIRLSDDAEYDSLNFRTSFKKGSSSKETSNDIMADDVDNMVYDALNFTDTADSPHPQDTSVFNDNVYSTLN